MCHLQQAGASKRYIGLRTDMDALPMQQHNTIGHASQVAGKMHACGHDGHTAMLLAAAQQLAQSRNFNGTVRLTFQPAEEGGAGGWAMIEGTGTAFGVDCELAFTRTYPATVNHAKPAVLACEVMTDIVGADQVVDQQPAMTAEDLAFMLEAVPGCHVFIGNGLGDPRDVGHGSGPRTLHNASYGFNDALIPLGATYRVRLAERCLAPVGLPCTRGKCAFSTTTGSTVHL